ncbi:MAG: S9 family peptidase [Gemmatimonadetes bacterium]|nr:S9 family peptidase [Gemmatimonadota bacterium]
MPDSSQVRRAAAALTLAALANAFTATTASAQDKPTLKPADFGKWESIGATRMSASGDWIAIGINRVDEENELHVRGGQRDTTIRIKYATQPAFTTNARWLGHLVTVAPKVRDQLQKDRKPVRTSFAARNLNGRDSIALADVSAFAFSPDGKYVALTRYPAEGKRVQDVIVHDLATGARTVFTGVGEHAWAESGSLLAFTTPGEAGAGGSLQLFDGSKGTTRVLDAAPGLHRSIAWRAKSTDLAVLRAAADRAFLDTTHIVLVWSRADQSAAAPRSLDPAALPQVLGAKARISDTRRPTWSADGATLYIGLRSREAVADQPKKSDEKVSDVEIWHAKDVEVIPQQRSSEQADLRATRVAAWRIGGNTVIPIAEDEGGVTTILEGDRYAVEQDRTPYPWGQMFGRRFMDVYAINLATGARTKALEKVRFFYATDPTGRRLAWFDGRDYWALEVASGKKTNLTASLTAGKKADFVDRDDDHPTDVLPPAGAPSWTADGESLLVNDIHDVWQLTLDGTGGTRLTEGAVARTRYRIASFAAFNATAAARAVDLTKPVYLSVFGKRTKRSGYAQLAGGKVSELIMADASVGALARADSAERYTYTRQTFVDSPNLFSAGATLADGRALTATNTFQRDYAWGRTELVNFTSTIGRPLQAILYYPANYDAKKKYPMIVYTYELLSDGLHRYITPRENDYYNANTFTQNGYFVLMPDIVFRPREPGVAVLHAVEPAVKSVIARGLVDPANIGHAGHSQGGYEAAYLSTHSSLFKTAVMGAGISDMISFAGQMHWSSVPEFDHWETGQFRMEVPPWEDFPAMLRNSPLNKIHEMKAKSLLIEIGSEDPTVDMRQGVLLYNYARRAGKDVVMLNYPGEGHGLGKRENAVDYQRRILQWFGHYLKGETAPKWITGGQTWLDRKKVLDANKDAPARPTVP